MAIGERDVIEVAHPTAPADAANKRLLLFNMLFLVYKIIIFQHIIILMTKVNIHVYFFKVIQSYKIFSSVSCFKYSKC